MGSPKLYHPAGQLLVASPKASEPGRDLRSPCMQAVPLPLAPWAILPTCLYRAILLPSVSSPGGSILKKPDLFLAPDKSSRFFQSNGKRSDSASFGLGLWGRGGKERRKPTRSLFVAMLLFIFQC